MFYMVKERRFIGIIPARYASTRFPGKPLVEIQGKSMIRRVYEQASKALETVYVATDDLRIA
jgi:3-deoxy-manno-octulosonate cytidylyltransferase (CMP-KDO synthetase)